MQGDAHRTGFPSASYDLVHARTLLINIPDPATLVAEMVRLARPGGRLRRWSRMAAGPCAIHRTRPGTG